MKEPGRYHSDPVFSCPGLATAPTELPIMRFTVYAETPVHRSFHVALLAGRLLCRHRIRWRAVRAAR